jgi:predicted alpha/beta superfamily hydrolase
MEHYELGEKHRVYSAAVGETREIVVGLPESYHGSTGVYPVLYLLDADLSLFHVHDVATVRLLSHVKSIPEVITVGVLNTDRDRDMLPVEVPEKESSGGADRFLRFIVEELIPSVNAGYRSSNYNLLYGASNAGLFCLYALLQRPDVFNGVVSSSPMIGWCGDHIQELAEERFRSPESLKTKLYMIYGRHDYRQVVDYVPRFSEYLRENAPEGLIWDVKIVEDEGHVPYTSVFDGLRFILGGRAVGKAS